MTAATPGRARSADQRAADVLTLLRGSRATLTSAELAAAVGCAAKTLVSETLPRLTKARLIIGVVEWVQLRPKKAPVALWRYYAAADETWPDWLPMPQEAPLPACHGAICDARLRGTVSSVWELGGAVA